MSCQHFLTSTRETAMKNLNIVIQLTNQSVFSSLILLASQQIPCCDQWHLILVTSRELHRERFLWLSPNNWRRPGGKSWSYRQVWTSKVSKKLSEFILFYFHVANGMWKYVKKFCCNLLHKRQMYSEFIVNIQHTRKLFYISTFWRSF